ncbi:unnamed protein product [Notodromas monacha]|uniref:1-acyl-sn-glycerol-3-phosphate acyltransferase n=1 Tax=Notodromas monacha TaxID=399045 RepID=A0A7R9BEN8_9CRUS|nr:unnamed protein product [Notodromas monacha]CAG0913960.1 unnamed protein product [Notodromas monacha]
MSVLLFICYVLGLWVVLFVANRRVRYVTKFVIYIVYVSSIATILLPFSALRPCNVRNANVSTWMVYWIAPLLGISHEVIGAEHLAEDRAAVVICNHQSLLDFLGMCKLWPIAGKLAAVAKREILFIWPFGLIAWLSGTVFIDRRHAAESRDVVNSTERLIKEKGIKLWVFAEGTRSSDGNLLPFKKGGFHLALRGKLPIIPVVMSWYGPFFDSREMRLEPGKVTIKILPAVIVDGTEDVTKLTEKVRADMQATLESISPDLPPIGSKNGFHASK